MIVNVADVIYYGGSLLALGIIVALFVGGFKAHTRNKKGGNNQNNNSNNGNNSTGA